MPHPSYLRDVEMGNYLRMNEIKYIGNYGLGEFEVNVISFSDFIVH